MENRRGHEDYYYKISNLKTDIKGYNHNNKQGKVLFKTIKKLQ